MLNVVILKLCFFCLEKATRHNILLLSTLSRLSLHIKFIMGYGDQFSRLWDIKELFIIRILGICSINYSRIWFRFGHKMMS